MTEMKAQPAMANPYADLVRVNRNEAEVYRGRERRAIVSVTAPAYASFSARGTERVSQVSTARNLGTAKPNRLELHYSNAARAIVAVPLLVTEETDDDSLFELSWSGANGHAAVNLLELLQPRNMAVPKGQVMELPVRVETVPPLGECLVIDMKEPVLRQVREESQQSPAGGAR